eukprot:4130658-Karenia_brevis.AAC.1
MLAPTMCCTTFCPHTHRHFEQRLDDFCFARGDVHPEGLDYVPGAVTKVLTREEILADHRNLDAIQAEGEALRSVGTWDESTVMKRWDLVNE